jgi:hypothetical protein
MLAAFYQRFISVLSAFYQRFISGLSISSVSAVYQRFISGFYQRFCYDRNPIPRILTVMSTL